MVKEQCPLDWCCLSTHCTAGNSSLLQLYFVNAAFTRNTLHGDQSSYSPRIVFFHVSVDFRPNRNSAIQSTDPENPTLEPNMELIGWSVVEISPVEFSEMAARSLGFGQTGNSAIRSADLENPMLEPNMKWIGRPLAQMWPFEKVGRSVDRRSVGRSLVAGPRSVGRSVVNIYFFLHWSHILLFTTLWTWRARSKNLDIVANITCRKKICWKCH